MTRFVKEYFDYHGGYLSYYAPAYKEATGASFVARLKYAQTSSKGRWITFMCKHLTVEAWAAARAEGLAPLEIMRAHGFELSHILKWRRDAALAQ